MADRVKVVIFDLDDTLAPSKTSIDQSMAELLVLLLDKAQVCIISGGQFEQFQNQVLRHLPSSQDFVRLHLMPTNGTQYYRWEDNSWLQIYAENLPAGDRADIAAVLTEGATELGLWETDSWGPIIEDRGSQITFSALGQAAPVEAKVKWDPDGSKKERLRAYAANRLPNLEVRSGGSTSIDVTAKGIDKAYGVSKLLQRLGFGIDEALFFGDRLDQGGNDYPVKAMGVRSVPVHDWEQTAADVNTLLKLPNTEWLGANAFQR